MQENPLNECRKQFFKVQKKETNQGICLQKKSVEIIPWKIENSFDKPTRIFSPKVRYVFLTVWKELKIPKILWKRKVFLQKWPLDTKKTVLTTMSIKFEKIPNFFHQSPLVSVNFLEQNDNVMPEDPLSECRKQFSKSGGTLSYGSPQRFSSKLEKIVKVNIFFRNQTFLEKYFVQVECTFDNFSKKFFGLVADCSAHCRKTAKKLKKFIQKTVQSKLSFRHKNCSFYEPAESSYRTPKTFSLKFRSKTWVFSEEKDYLTQNSSPTQHFLTKVRKFFDQYSKKMWKIFLQKSNFQQKFFVLVSCRFDKLFEVFAPKCHNVFLTARRRWKQLKTFVEKLVQSKISTGHIKCSFDKPIAKFLSKIQKVCAQSPKKEKIERFCFRKKTLPKLSPGHLKTVLTTQPDYFRQKSEMFSSKSERTEIYENFVKKEKFSSKMTSGHKENSFDYLVKKFSQKSKQFPSNSVSTRTFFRGKW